MEESPDTSRVALKIVFILSVLLVLMDLLEFYLEYQHLLQMSIKFDAFLFEQCIKYHALTQMFFTFFATFAGLSAALMSLGLLVNYEFFVYKIIDTFLFYNYLIFGPYLLAACLIGLLNYNLVLFNCDSREFTNKMTLNFSTLLALVICSMISFIITAGYSVFYGIRKMINSIRFNRNGNYLIGRIFWQYVLYRNRDNNNEREVELNELNENNINN